MSVQKHYNFYNYAVLMYKVVVEIINYIMIQRQANVFDLQLLNATYNNMSVMSWSGQFYWSRKSTHLPLINDKCLPQIVVFEYTSPCEGL